MKQTKSDDLPLNSFAKALLKWNQQENHRQMPWKGEKDPYKIWLSEIILQQTRVEQGLKYYQNFITRFPDIHSLANAPQGKVFKLWEGLGYYSRCTNLIATAQFISKELNGDFPKEYESILQLKGIGRYTAAAIASFAYNLPYAVLDGNVFRVLSRIFDIETLIDSTEGKKEFTALAQKILPKEQAGKYNQAIMDFGATICKPLPLCNGCFFKNLCRAYQSGKQNLLPVKKNKNKSRERWLNYIVFRYKKFVLIRQRNSKDVWQNLFEFLLIEKDQAFREEKLIELCEQEYGNVHYTIKSRYEVSQRLTHQVIHFKFLQLELSRKENLEGFEWVKLSDLVNYAFPKTLQQFISTQIQ